MDGYQGLSSRSRNHRQQVSNRFSNQTGLPIAPARWAVEVSTLITRSRFSTKAAVSAKSVSSSVKSYNAMPEGGCRDCSDEGPSCNEKNAQPGMAVSGASFA